jgi:ketosteroid isomerase-like protein
MQTLAVLIDRNELERGNIQVTLKKPSEPEPNKIAADRLQELCDRQDILDCVHRYCRAVDRADREQIISVYHPDAIDDHGVFVGNRESFADWAIAYHAEFQHATHHIVTNHTCELEGDTAHTETYWLFSGVNKQGPAMLSFGRYVDRFERRNGRWAIAARACLIEWIAGLTEWPLPPGMQAIYASAGVSSRTRSDKSYERPLRVRKCADKLGTL